MLPYTEFLLTKSTLPPRHRELLWLRTAWLARSDYLWAQRAPAARRAGVTDVELARIAFGPDAPGWEPFEAALLRAADELHVDVFVNDSTWNALAARYDANQLTDLVYGVGEIALHAGFASTLRRRDRAGAQGPVAVRHRLRSRGAANERALDRQVRHASSRCRPPRAGPPSANVFRTFARNPPADELRNAVGRHIRDETSLSAAQSPTADHACGRAVPLGVRVGRALADRSPSRSSTTTDVARVVAGPSAAPGGSPLETACCARRTSSIATNIMGNAVTRSPRSCRRGGASRSLC